MLAGLTLLGGCADDDVDVRAVEITVEADEPAALAVAPDGTLLYGERLNGRVFTLAPPYGETEPQEITEVAVAGDAQDQRGLLGMAVESGAVYASYTREEDGRLVVAEIGRVADEGVVEPTAARLVWEGPESSERANGGHLAVAPDGRLVVGVGDLLDRERVDDPEAPNGKLLALDRAGTADQRPAVLSGGWNNPFAFTYDDGVLWVADNAGPSGAERIGRGDRRDARLAELRPPDDQMAPAALVPLGDGDLGVCGFLTGRMLRVDVDEDTATPTDDVVAEPCRLGAVALPDGRVAMADRTELVVASR